MATLAFASSVYLPAPRRSAAVSPRRPRVVCTSTAGRVQRVAAAAPDGGGSASAAPDAGGAAWREGVAAGAVVEAWVGGRLVFGRVVSRTPAGAVVRVARAGERKVSFGEVVAVWPRHLCAGDDEELSRDVDAGMRLIRTSRPRALNLAKVYGAMRGAPKGDARAVRTSFQLAQRVFPLFMKGPRARRAAATVATGVLMEGDGVRFRRGGEGRGWRAVPPSVAVARTRCTFVEVCRMLIDSATPARERGAPWTRDQLEILHSLEICAASGAAAKGTAGTALAALGYQPTDDGAAALLLDIGYWATGTLEEDGGGLTQDAASTAGRKGKGAGGMGAGMDAGMGMGMGAGAFSALSDSNRKDILAQVKTSAGKGAGASRPLGKVSGGADGAKAAPEPEVAAPAPAPAASRSMREWTFPPQILAEARDTRARARERRRGYAEGGETVRRPRRSLLAGLAEPLRVYCVDDRNARFLDDAVSIQVLQPGKLVRVCLHIADVDETVLSGSAVDELAKERGQSLYLPLKPLHMLPAATMDAASFSTASPVEGITALMDVDVTSGELVFWEIFASLVPPVVRVNYNQFDAVLEGRIQEAGLSAQAVRDLQGIAAVAPVLAEKLDTRKNSRKTRRGGADKISSESSERGKASGGGGKSTSGVAVASASDTGIASVRLVRRKEYGPNAGRTKVAQVVDFRNTGGHAVIADMLISVSTLFRQFAHRHGAFLPEDRGAHQYVSRCGTAPMRRYSDLAIQRQIKCILFGREPAGRRRMDELRYWLARRHAAGERTVATARKVALYESLADHCAQQQAVTKLGHATVKGRVRSVSVSRKNTLRAEVSLDGTGLYTLADVSDSAVRARGGAPPPPDMTRDERAAHAAKQLSSGDAVQLHVSRVDTVAQRIVSRVVAKIQR